MKVSINWPTLREYISGGVGLNVSPEADAVFLASLKRTDRDRYDRLMASIERGAYVGMRTAHQPGLCRGCNTALAGKRKDAKFCSDVCRKRHAGQDRQIIPETHIQNIGVADAILRS